MPGEGSTCKARCHSRPPFILRQIPQKGSCRGLGQIFGEIRGADKGAITTFQVVLLRGLEGGSVFNVTPDHSLMLRGRLRQRIAPALVAPPRLVVLLVFARRRRREVEVRRSGPGQASLLLPSKVQPVEVARGAVACPVPARSGACRLEAADWKFPLLTEPPAHCGARCGQRGSLAAVEGGEGVAAQAAGFPVVGHSHQGGWNAMLTTDR